MRTWRVFAESVTYMHVAIGLFPVFTTYLSLHNALYSVIATMQAWIIDYDAWLV